MPQKKLPNGVIEVNSGFGEKRYEAINEPDAMTWGTPEEAAERYRVIDLYSKVRGRTR